MYCSGNIVIEKKKKKKDLKYSLDDLFSNLSDIIVVLQIKFEGLFGREHFLRA